jgi:hypothetical protein
MSKGAAIARTVAGPSVRERTIDLRAGSPSAANVRSSVAAFDSFMEEP